MGLLKNADAFFWQDEVCQETPRQAARWLRVPCVSAAWVYLKPRLRRLATGSIRNHKASIAVLIVGSIVSTEYYFWERHIEVTNPLRIGVATQLMDTMDTSLPIGSIEGARAAGRELVARAQLENELLYTDVQSFVCAEHMQRYRGSLDARTGNPIDVVTARVSFAGGVERYSDIHENNMLRASMSSVPGAWSEGEFGTLLRQTHALLATAPLVSRGEATFENRPAAMYRMTVRAEDSPWDLMIGGESFKIPFRTDVWVAKHTGQILRIERTSTAMPPGMGISQLRWSVTLEPVTLDGKTWLLPKTGKYEVAYASSKRRDWNEMTFSDYQRYGSRAILHF